MAIARDHQRDSRSEHDHIDQSRKDTMKAAFRWFFVRFLLLLGLCGICAIGTFTFQALEKPNELSTCEATSKLYVTMEERYAQTLWSIGQSYFNNKDSASQLDTLDKMTTTVGNFFSDLSALGNFDGRNCSLMGTADGVEFKWNTFGSVLFATTIFTTVGYGNIAPVTSWGRIVVFAYGMVSIPYMLWCLSMLGELLADVFQFVYVNICCLGLCAKRARRRQREQLAIEKQKRLREALLEKKLGVTGIPVSWKDLYSAREEEMNRLRGQANALMVDDVEDDEDEEDDDVSIPLTVTLLVIFGYIMLGAVMFGMWEGWTAMAAAYYCFITISTIGFGDIVPGAAAKGVKATTDAVKLMVVAVYIFAGMAIISMAFNLIQENMAKKAKAIENKITKNKSDEDEDDGDKGNTEGDGPLTARSVMPMMMQPALRPQPALFPFGAQPLAENWTERVKAMSQPPPPVITKPEERQEAADVENTADGATSADARSAKSAKPPVEETSLGEAKKDESSLAEGGHVKDIPA